MWKDRRGCPKKGQDPTVSSYDEIVVSAITHHTLLQIKEVPELDPANQTAVALDTYNALQHDHIYTHSLQHPLTHTFDRCMQNCTKYTNLYRI